MVKNEIKGVQTLMIGGFKDDFDPACALGCSLAGALWL